MKKKLIFVINILIVLLVLTSCQGKENTATDYNGFTADQLRTNSESTISTLVNMTTEEQESYLTDGTDAIIELITNWNDIVEEDGAYSENGEFKVEVAGDTLSTYQVIVFENRKATLTIVYAYDSMEMQDISIESIYTIGETMEKAALNSVTGILTVFTVLVMISLVIACLNIIPYLTKLKEERAQKQAVPKKKPKKVKSKAIHTEQETIIQEEDDLALVAVITAAIAATQGMSTDDFTVRSIRRRL